MSGNVWEWCLDYCDFKSGVVTDTYKDGMIDPLCKTGSYRVYRGGSWYAIARSCRVATRYGNSPGDSYYGFGFRVAFANSSL